MRLLSKINFKKFFVASPLVTGAFCFFTASIEEVYVILGVYIATLVNLSMLTEAILELTRQDVHEENSPHVVNKEKVIYLFLGKVAVLIFALILGVQVIGNKIIIAVINYILQIFILVLSLKRS